MLIVSVFYDKTEKTVLYSTEKAVGLKFSTQLPGGFSSCSFTAPARGWEATKLYRLFPNTHVVVFDKWGRRLYEGRVEDRTLSNEGVAVQAEGYYTAANDVSAWITFPASGDYVVGDLVMHAVDMLSPTFWAEDYSFISPNDLPLGAQDLEFMGEQKIVDIITKALSYGAGSVEMIPAHFALWENRRAHYFAEKQPSSGQYDWAVTIDIVNSDYSLSSSLKDVYNKVQTVFDHPTNGQTWLGYIEDKNSQALYGVREGTLNAGQTDTSIAEVAQELALKTAAYPEQQASFELQGKAKSVYGYMDELYMLRAGQLLRVDDFDDAGLQLMTGTVGKDLAIGFINRTDYDADKLTLSVELGHSSMTMDLLVARLGLSSGGLK